jgi:rubrerythrin
MTPVNPKILESLNYGINQEIKSYVFYMEAAKRMGKQEFKDTLLKLASEEKEHYQILESQHHSLITSEQWVTYNDILKREGLPEIDEEMADKHKELVAAVSQAEDEREILDIAYKLEEEAFTIFSEAAGRAVDAEEKRTFEFLMKFEKGHMRLIQSMIDSL